MKHLYESIFDDDIVTRKTDPEEYIREWINDNYYHTKKIWK